ncbi:MAG: DUF456 domain-containing protein [Muribaculaceae bacterium]|nr:DUF456 domain-containing protein [Muribaculaceae bacterium]
MEYVLVVLAVLCLVTGIAGCIVPMIPGPPISYCGLLCLHFTDAVEFSAVSLLVWGALVIVTIVLDYVIPSLGTRYFGGSKWGTWGCVIGTFAGLFVLPWGIILGPFLGAFIGELIGQRGAQTALKSGIGSLIGFVLGTFMKMVLCIYFVYEAIAAAV